MNTIPLPATALPQPLTALKIRGMKIVLTLQRGIFPDSGGSNVKTIYSASLPNYLHCDVAINRLPAWQGNTATIIIYGMKLQDCFAATKYNTTIDRPYYNQVEVYAGYLTGLTPIQNGQYDQTQVEAAINTLQISYLGQVFTAFTDFNDTNRPFIIQSVMTNQSANTLINPTAINSQTLLSSCLQSIIQTYNNTNPQIQWQLGQINPDIIVNNAHLIGTSNTQLKNLCDNYGYNFRLDASTVSSSTGISQPIFLVNVTSLNAATIGNNINTIDVQSGMIGYLSALPLGITVMEFYNPQRQLNEYINLITYNIPFDSSNAGIYYIWQIQTFLQTNGDAWQSTLTMYGAGGGTGTNT